VRCHRSSHPGWGLRMPELYVFVIAAFAALTLIVILAMWRMK
jgi:hypothetical protein